MFVAQISWETPQTITPEQLDEFLILDAIGVDWYPTFLVLLPNLRLISFSSGKTW